VPPCRCRREVKSCPRAVPRLLRAP
jgi:hypothetical protein